MAKYQRIQTEEASQYSGPKITVVSDALGEQTANAGDWLLGCERGKVHVKTSAQFESEGWTPYSATPTDDELAATKASLATQQANNAGLQANLASLQSGKDALQQQVTYLSGKVGDTDSLTQQVADLKVQLETLTTAKAESDAALAEAQGHLKALAAAQQTIQEELGGK